MKPGTAVLIVTLAAACGDGAAGPDSGAPPLPSDVEALEPVLAAKIRSESDAVRAQPQDPAAWTSLGMTYEANEMLTLALDCYERALVLQDGAGSPGLERAKVWSRIAQANATLGRLERATEAMQSSVRLVDDYAPSHWRLGGYLFDLGSFAEARVAYRTATELDPRHTGGWLGLARIALQEGEPDEAVRTLESILEKKSRDADALRLLRTAYLQAGRPQDAASLSASWRRKSSPGKDPWLREFREYRERPLMETALADLQGGKPAEAVEVLEVFAEENPDDLNVLSYLAWGYFLLEREAEALATIDEALERDANSIPVLRVLARVHEGGERPSQALATVDRILELDARDTAALRKQGRLRREQGDLAGAVDSYRRYLELDRAEPAVWVAMGECQLALERWTDAVETYRGALENRLRLPELQRGLATALARLGRWKEAEAALTGTVPIDEASRALLESIQRRSL